jgi:UDP-sugar transporter A1/2/3
MPSAEQQLKFMGVSLRQISLVTLAVQNSFLILAMRYSRMNKDLYLASTAVLLSELFKLTICVGVYLHTQITDSHQTVKLFTIYRWLVDVFRGDAWKLSIPAVLYTIQNNLQYLAVTNLDAATFQVTYQLKILTTAIISVWMLGKRLSGVQWVSLCLLTMGVALVQLPEDTFSYKDPSDESGDILVETPDENVPKGNRFVGLMAVFIACCLSGLAGVYFEKILKKPNQNSSTNTINARPPPSIWERNIQLATFGALLSAIFGVYGKDYEAVMSKGFFQGYTSWTYIVITAQAVGGLIVAMVVKYADNILKGFATSISIIISCMVSVWLFDFNVTWSFIFGAAFVIYSTYLYDSPPANGKKGDGPFGGYCPPVPGLK